MATVKKSVSPVVIKPLPIRTIFIHTIIWSFLWGVGICVLMLVVPFLLDNMAMVSSVPILVVLGVVADTTKRNPDSNRKIYLPFGWISAYLGLFLTYFAASWLGLVPQ